MARNLSSRAGGLAAVALVLSCGVARASPLQLEFHSLFTGLGNFTVDFNDNNGDRLLEFDEITGFSGLDLGPPAIGGSTTYHFTSILYVPTVSGVSVSNCASSDVNVCRTTNWKFSDGTHTSDVGGSRFGSYTIVDTGGRVPEPPAAALAVTALLALALRGRRGAT